MNKNFLVDIMKYLPGKIVPAIVGFISVPIITRLFPPETYGNYAFALSIVNFLAIAVGWVGMSNIRFYPVYEKQNKLLEYSSVVFKIASYSILITAILFSVTLILIKSTLNSELFGLLWVAIPFFMLFTFFTVSQNFLRVNNRVGLFSLSGIWRVITSFLFGLALVVWFNLGIEGLFWGSIISLTLIIGYVYRKSFGKVDLRINLDYSLLKQFFYYSYPLVLSSGFALVTKFSDRFFIMHFRDSYEVGLYSANFTIADHSIMLIVTLFLYAAHPMSIKIWEQKGEQAAKEFLSSTTGFYIAVALPAVVGMSILYKEITTILLDEQYYAGASVLPIICAAKFFFGIQQRYQSGIHFFKKTIYVTYSIVLASIVSIVLNIILIPIYGFKGATISMLIAYFAMAVYMAYYSRKLIKWDFPLIISLKSIGSTLAMAVVLVVSPFQYITNNIYISLFFKVLIGVSVYFLLMVLLKAYKIKKWSTLLKF